MNKYPRKKLKRIYDKYENTILEDPEKLKGLLYYYCGNCEMEVDLLIKCLELGIPHKLNDNNIKKMIKRMDTDEKQAKWAVYSWGQALDVIKKKSIFMKFFDLIIRPTLLSIFVMGGSSLAFFILYAFIILPLHNWLFGHDPGMVPYLHPVYPLHPLANYVLWSEAFTTPPVFIEYFLLTPDYFHDFFYGKM